MLTVSDTVLNEQQTVNRPERPRPLAIHLDSIPSELGDRPQWVAWEYQHRERADPDKAWTKVPLDPKNRNKASPTNPFTWGTLKRAVALYQNGQVDGIGFVVTPDDPYVGIDVDDCRNALTGEIAPWVLNWISRFDSYTEVSPSGQGVRIWIEAEALLPGGKYGRRTRVRDINVEVYSANRFLTVTGHRVAGSPATIEPRQEVLAEFLDAVGIVGGEPRSRSADTPRTPPHSDETVHRLAANAKNREKFQRLWEGDTSDYGGDNSRADQALCSLLAFWTQDPEQIDRLFRQSGLYRSDKWERDSYREPTIDNALDRDEVYQPSSNGAHAGEHRAEADDADAADDPSQTSENKKARGSQATLLVDMIVGAGAELFHDPNDQAYVTASIGDHLETLAVDGIGNLLNKLYYRAYGEVANNQALQDAIGALKGKALYDGPQYTVWTRLGEHNGTLYLDLGDEAQQAVEIDAEGWRLVRSHALPVKFRRPKGMKALPLPVRDGSLHDLDSFVNVSGDNDRMLIKGWLIGLFCQSGGRAILELLGEQGSSKSTLADMLRRLIDPCTVPLRAAPRDEQDLIIAANNGLIVAFDNLSYISEAMSDAYCRLSTGGGIGKRRLYTDLDEVILEAQCPILLTGISGVVTRSDMLDRTISVTLPPIPDEKRRTEDSVWAEFDAARSRIVGGLLDAVSASLANRETFCLERIPRLADFVMWVEAAGPALGWKPGQFAEAIQKNRSDLDEISIESQAIGLALLSLMDERPKWTGTASALLKKLSGYTNEDMGRDRSWPKGANQCSKQLARLAPNLRRMGIEVVRERSGKRGTRTITLSRMRTE
jgi:primase-polymerase (primpol)-like protein